ncbi:MAG: hypothetical protein LUQ36_06245 [Methanoregula sp.]|nr:hypothetical protein [Methanoregula sp.]
MQLPRVRRLKYHGYDAAAIEHSCREDIAMMRALAVPQEIARELWVRGPDRAWHRYCVLRNRSKSSSGMTAPGCDSAEGRGNSSLFSTGGVACQVAADTLMYVWRTPQPLHDQVISLQDEHYDSGVY